MVRVAGIVWTKAQRWEACSTFTAVSREMLGSPGRGKGEEVPWSLLFAFGEMGRL